MYGNIALSVYKKDYTLRCLEYILFSIFTIKTLTNWGLVHTLCTVSTISSLITFSPNLLSLFRYELGIYLYIFASTQLITGALAN